MAESMHSLAVEQPLVGKIDGDRAAQLVSDTGCQSSALGEGLIGEVVIGEVSVPSPV